MHPVRCNQCRLQFDTKTEGNKHLRATGHSQGVPYICTTCGETFKKLKGLKGHIRVHEISDSTSSAPSSPGAPAAGISLPDGIVFSTSVNDLDGSASLPRGALTCSQCPVRFPSVELLAAVRPLQHFPTDYPRPRALARKLIAGPSQHHDTAHSPLKPPSKGAICSWCDEYVFRDDAHEGCRGPPSFACRTCLATFASSSELASVRLLPLCSSIRPPRLIASACSTSGRRTGVARAAPVCARPKACRTTTGWRTRCCTQSAGRAGEGSKVYKLCCRSVLRSYPCRGQWLRLLM